MNLFRIGLLAIALSLAACSEDGKLGAEDAWIREAPPNATALAGYVKLHNPSAADQVLIGAQSKDFGAIEMHRTVIKDEVARMHRQDTVPIPAKESVAFKPGSHHLMLFRPQRALKSGDEVTVTLKFENGQSLDVPFTVKRPE